MRLLGRGRERDALNALLEGARTGLSGALVVQGEPGIGKTALLDDAADSAADFQVTRVAGMESEIELSFAALHQLCNPMLDRLDRLPDPQANALRVAFGLRTGESPDRLFVGLAVLSLVSAVARDAPLLWVIDDAHWLDQASGTVLGFVARRLGAESVVLLFGQRRSAGASALSGVPELVLGGLSDADSRELLASALPGRFDERVQERIVAEAQGNPLALLELPRASTPAALAGGFGAGPVLARLEDSFRRRVERLPVPTRQFILLAAAEPLGDAELLRAAAGRLGLGADAAVPAEDEGLLRIRTHAAFRHPLVRSAVYQAASPEARRTVHRALGETTNANVSYDSRCSSRPTPSRWGTLRTRGRRTGTRRPLRGTLAGSLPCRYAVGSGSCRPLGPAMSVTSASMSSPITSSPIGTDAASSPWRICTANASSCSLTFPGSHSANPGSAVFTSPTSGTSRRLPADAAVMCDACFVIGGPPFHSDGVDNPERASRHERDGGPPLNFYDAWVNLGSWGGCRARDLPIAMVEHDDRAHTTSVAGEAASNATMRDCTVRKSKL
jgi:hypothetical protein